MSDAGDGYVAQSSDTDVAADRIQFQIYAKMSVAEKVEAFENLCRDARELSLIGLRLRYPQASEEELFLREAAQRLGEELTRTVYGTRFDELVR